MNRVGSLATSDLALISAIAETAFPLTGDHHDYDALVEAVGDARLVLIGEASHGTHEFYRERAQLTKRLIVEKGFTAVAAEADWPDGYRVNRFVQASSGPSGVAPSDDAIDALSGFRRFPQWMWRNADVLDFIGWLRTHNDDTGARVGFYGLDLYSLHTSMHAGIAHLDRIDPAAAARARRRYGCFENFGADPQDYGYATGLGLIASCEDEVVAQLIELQSRRAEELRRGGLIADDEQLAAEQNARVVRSAEKYYRAMFAGRVNTWNLRDQHMVDTLDELLRHLDRRAPAKIVVWAHNSHLGDARATEMALRGELNVGQLCRERYGTGPGGAVNIGMTTDHGSVSAASTWDAPVERKRVRPALEGSYEALFHAVGIDRFRLDLRVLGEAAGGLYEPRLERAIGVIYQPATERLSHYFGATLPRQFDFVLHFDETRAVEPLERTAAWDAGELPETYPSSL